MKTRRESICPLDKIESLNPRAVIAKHISDPVTTTIPGSSRRPGGPYPRFRPDSQNDDNRSDLRQDPGDLSKSGQSGVGTLEFGARSQRSNSL